MNTKWMLSSTLALIIAGTAFAQDQPQKDTAAKKEQRVIVRKKTNGDKTETMTVVVDGDKVTINGKPVDQLNDKDVRIFRGQPGPDGFTFSGPGMHGDGNLMMAPRMNKKITVMNNRAFLGVMTEKTEKGAKITEVTKESAAEKAGLKKDDIITKVNDTKITDPQNLFDAIGKLKPEEKVKITYLRNNKETTATATLSKNKDMNFELNADNFNFDFPKNGDFDAFSGSMMKRTFKPRLGIQIQDLEEGNGVKVTGVDEESPAKKAGLKENDIITDINGSEVKDVDDLRTKIKDLKEGDTYKVIYKRDGKPESIDIKIPKKLKTANL